MNKEAIRTQLKQLMSECLEDATAAISEYVEVYSKSLMDHTDTTRVATAIFSARYSDILIREQPKIVVTEGQDIEIVQWPQDPELDRE